MQNPAKSGHKIRGGIGDVVTWVAFCWEGEEWGVAHLQHD